MIAEKVHLRPITAADTAKIVAWRNKEFVRKNFIYQKLFTEESHMAWLHEQVEPGHVVQFIICLTDSKECPKEKHGGADKRETEHVKPCMEKTCESEEASVCREIGSVYLRDIDRTAGTAEYGVFIGEEDALGRGYGTAAAKLMLAYGFEKLELKKIFLRFVEGNAGAWKSYEKAGFCMIEDRRETVSLEQGERAVFFMETERSAWERKKRLGTEKR